MKSNYKELFYQSLEDLFVGAEVEGQGGYVNLLKIKRKYYNKVVQKLKELVQEKLEGIEDFEQELYEKLWTFFKRYFSEVGSIYFKETSYPQSVYERFYEDKDVVLFWKTKDLYYIKTDRLFRSMEVSINGLKFYFDTGELEHKKANEKKALLYELKGVKGNTITLKATYAEGQKKTNTDAILKNLKKFGLKVKEEDLKKAISTFEKQAKVDYFLNKRVREFLKEQFKLFLVDYVWNAGELTEDRVKKLNILKEVAYKIIDFISQFEEELVRLWEKPKFVRKSNYVITLDRIEAKGGLHIIEKIERHPNYPLQVKEWIELGILEKNPEGLLEKDVFGSKVKEEYKFLPIDTRYFKDLELEILDLFDDLDQELDGWLIKSENWQALNTILPKFKEKVQTIYIDPPFNKGENADYEYLTDYKDSTWATMLENRLRFAREFLKDTGSIFVRCDYNGNWILRPLMNEIFGEENFRNEIVVSRISKQDPKVKKFNSSTDTILFFSKSENIFFKPLYKTLKKIKEERWHSMDSQGQGKPLYVFGYLFNPPEGRHWTFKQEKILQMEQERKIRIVCRRCNYIHTEGKWKGCPICSDKENVRIEYLLPPTSVKQIDSNWTDISGYTSNWDFPTENSEMLLKRVIESTSDESDFVMDFFLGSGTTVAVAHKLRRKWLGIEMGSHFYTVVLPRMKKVLAYDSSGISKEKDIKERYNEKSAGGFFKYFELEQYSDALSKAVYKDTEPLDAFDIFNQYIFLVDDKFLGQLKIKEEKENYIVELTSKLYPDIDFAESLSCLSGKWIKKIGKNTIIFEDESVVDLTKLELSFLKKLLLPSDFVDTKR